MAKITDPDDLVRSTTSAQLGIDGNIWIDVSTKEISLSAYSALDSTSFVDGGVSIQAVYSYLKEEWKTDNDLIKYPFPMVAITPEQFEFVDDWKPSGDTATSSDGRTVNLFRDGGFSVATGGTNIEEYVGAISLGSLTEGTQMYYQQASGNTAPSDFVLTGAVNQCVKVYGGPSQGDFDYRDYFKVFAREQAKIYGQADHDDIGVSLFTYQAYRFPVSNSNDLKVTLPDSGVTGLGVTITYYTVGQEKIIGGSSYYFDIIVDGNGETKENIYMAVQERLRSTDDIDAGAGEVSGKTADLLLAFVGDTLVTETGVFIEDFDVSDTNFLQYTDTGGTSVTYPYVAAGSISFNDNLSNDADSIYRLFFTNNDTGDDDGSDYGTSDAILVRSNDKVEAKTDISFSATGNIIVSQTTSFTDSTFTYNQVFEVSGTALQSSNNPFFVTVTAVTANQLSCEETLVDEEDGGDDIYIYEIIGGNVSAQTSISFSYDYDFNEQRGTASSGTTAPVTLVAIGLDSAQYVKTTGNITRTNANTLSLVAALERNYSNPV